MRRLSWLVAIVLPLWMALMLAGAQAGDVKPPGGGLAACSQDINAACSQVISGAHLGAGTVPNAALATDPTNASNLSSGKVAPARLPINTGAIVDANNCTTACTALYSFALPGNTLGATGGMRLTVVGHEVNTTTATSIEFKLNWGGSAVCDTGSNLGTLANSATVTPFMAIITIINTATNAQGVHCLLFQGANQQAGWNNTTPGTTGALSLFEATTAVDTTVSQTLSLTMTFGAASTSTHVVTDGAHLEPL